jgi:NAD-reducing hydrogenase large subunit
VQQVRLHIVEFRGFEKFIEGRPYWEVPVMVQRLCGICPVSHHLAAAKALDRVVGAHAGHADGRQAPPADALRPGDAVARAALLPPVVARPAVRLRLRREPAQHRRRGRGASGHREEGRDAAQVRPGGDPRHRRQAGARHRLGARRHEQARQRSPTARCCSATCPDAGLGADAVDIAKQLHAQNPALYDRFGSFRSNMLSLVAPTARWSSTTA